MMATLICFSTLDTPFSNSVSASFLLSAHLPHNSPMNHSCFSFSSFNPCRCPHLDKTESICFEPDPSWILFIPEHQRPASVQCSLYSHWATASLSLFPLLCSSLAPFISFLCDCPPPLRLLPFLSILHLVIPYSFQSQRPTLHPKLSLLISVLSPHINIPQPLLLPVNRVTLQSAVTPLPPDSMPSLSLPHSCG